MWSRANRIERIAQRSAGVVAIAALVTLPWLTTKTNPARAASLTGESLTALLAAQERVMRIEGVAGDAEVPERFVGAEVYERRADGRGAIMGRIAKDSQGYYLVLPKDSYRKYISGADLLWAKPVRNFGDALEIVLAPGGADAEFEIAKQQLWPVIESELVKPMTLQVEEEIRRAIGEFPAKQSGTINKIGEELYNDLAPEMNQLTEKLVTRAWDEIGVWGVASGLWRKGSEAVTNAYESTKDWVKSVFDDESKDGERTSNDFLSDERKEALRKAMREEITAFWDDKGEEITAKANATLKRHEAELTKDLRNELMPGIYEKVSKGLWVNKQSKVMEGFNAYFADLSRRRFSFTDAESGDVGPQLSLAFAIRTGAGISRSPLLVIQERKGGDGTLTLKPYAENLKLDATKEPEGEAQ